MGRFPSLRALGDAFIDDLAILLIGSLAKPPAELAVRMGRADEMYAAVGLPVKAEKSTEASLRGDV